MAKIRSDRPSPNIGRTRGGTGRISGAKAPSRPTTRSGRTRAGRFGSFAKHVTNKKGQFVSQGRGFSWVGIDAVIDNFDRCSNTFITRTRREADRLAERMENYARANARWEDRTGDARAGLKGIVVDAVNGEGFTIAFGHSVYYGFFLEYKYGGQYAIINETVNWASNQLAERMSTNVWAMD